MLSGMTGHVRHADETITTGGRTGRAVTMDLVTGLAGRRSHR
jgi:hypothetical protein